MQSTKNSKLDPKSRKCIFLNYEIGVKGYSLWDLDAKVKVINRDVSFNETFVLNQKEKETTNDRHK